jgi:hypothetical protein
LPSIVNNISSSLLQWNLEESLIFELLILNDKCYNEHYPLETWWHWLYDNFHIFFWNGGAVRLVMEKTPVT